MPFLLSDIPECLKKGSKFHESFPLPLVIKRLSKTVLKYSSSFFEVLKKHAASEFEIQIRDGKISDQSSLTLDILQQDSTILDYTENLRNVFLNCHRMIKRNHQMTHNLVDVVEENVMKWLEKQIISVQEKTLKSQRQKNLQLCKSKCSTGPQIFNFTNSSINPKLKLLLES